MKKILLVLLACLSFNAFSAVNINTATQAELETLEGVGPVKAKAIVDYRKKNGAFKSIDELEKVDGIGAITLGNIRKDVTTSGKTTITEKAPSAATIANKNTTKASEKTVKEKTVGTTKAAESGKTADSKSVKEDKSKDSKKEKATKEEKVKEEKPAKDEKDKKESKAKKEKTDKKDKEEKGSKTNKEKKSSKDKSE